MKTPYQLPTLAILPIALCFGSLHGQEKDPFVKKNQKEAPKPQADISAMRMIRDTLPRNIQVTFEAFSLPITEAAKINRRNLSSVESYKLMITMSEEGSAKQEILTSVTALPGQTATTEGIQELIYPTEFVPSQGDPNTPEEGAPEQTALTPVPATPSAFETKNLGVTLEVEAQIAQSPNFVPLTEKGAALLVEHDRIQRSQPTNQDPFEKGGPSDSTTSLVALMKACDKKDLRMVDYVEIRFTPTFVKQTGLGKWGQGPSQVEMPVFEVQSVRTGVTLVAGEPYFMGTYNPPKNGEDGPEGEEKVWFAYVTASIKTAGL